MFSYEICELFKNILIYRTPPVAASENDEQQQLSEGFAVSWCKIVSLILLQKLINNFAVCKHYSRTLLLLLKMQLVATVLETRNTYLKKKPHFLIDQPRTCYIFILGFKKKGNQWIL